MAMTALRLAGASFCTKEAPWGPLELVWAPQKLPLLFHSHRAALVSAFAAVVAAGVVVVS